jgi:peptidoglycan/xylan/chitin deacetylase (PgdA/CDA1 family)
VDRARLQDLLSWAEGSDGNGASAAVARVVRARLENGEPDAADVAEATRWAKAARNDRSAATRSRARGVLAVAGKAVPQPNTRPRRKAQRSARFTRPTPLLSVRLSRRAKAAAVVLAVAALAAAAVLGATKVAQAAFRPALIVEGPPSGAAFGRAQIGKLAFAVRADRGALAKEDWTLDGGDVTQRVRFVGNRLVLRPAKLDDGEHTIEISQGGGFLGASTHRRIFFTVDLTPPQVHLLKPLLAKQWRPLRIAAQTEAGARVTIAGRQARVNGDGRIAASLPPPLPEKLMFRVIDAAGNRWTRRLPVAIEPRRPPVAVRGVHVTAYGWADNALRNGVLQLIAQHRVNAVEIDLKDEGGLVGFDPPVPLARRIGAAHDIYDLDKLVRQLHARGIRVIGRLVCFRDPILARAAWKRGRHDEVIQTPGGGPYAGYGGFTNFANPIVRRYNVDIAVAAARAGVDDVLYDYVRRPDGPLNSMVFPGLRGDPAREIVRFLRETRLALRPYGTYFGVSVFGVAATRPDEVAQDIPRMAHEADYVSPMVYPSHWGPGEYNVSNPNAQPYQIVARSLRDFKRDTHNTGARLVPWLQDFTLGVTYGPEQVRAQIEAARRDGIREFLLWDPLVTYTSDALTPDAPAFSRGLAKPRPAAEAPSSTAQQPPPAKKQTPAAPGVTAVEGRKPNELGVIPVIMHHEIRPDRVGAFDQTPAEFRAELEKLWRQGYWPVTAADLATGRLGAVPAGKTPVVLTFDDSTQFQFFYTPDGKIKSNTAIAIMLDFAREHPAFKPAGTFYVLREPFAGISRGPAMLRWLVAHGFELGDHTHDHIPLNTLDDGAVQRELVEGARVITHAVPSYRITTMALPLGALPHRRRLALRGRWHGQSYSFAAVFLAGAEPAPSPFTTTFDRNAVPRIRTSHLPWNGERDFCAEFWLHELKLHPKLRYVSDGDPARITFPRSDGNTLAPRYRARANPY